LDTCHPDSLYLRQQGCEDPWLFFEAKRIPRAKKVWELLGFLELKKILLPGGIRICIWWSSGYKAVAITDVFFFCVQKLRDVRTDCTVRGTLILFEVVSGLGAFL